MSINNSASKSAANQETSYDAIGCYITEIYNQHETQRDDVALIKSLIGDRPVRILEPFCGNGRILVPLAEAGHEIMGMDISVHFLENLHQRLRQLPQSSQSRASFRKMDVISEHWPDGFDVVILGGNCFYELAGPDEQEYCIREAASALKSGGYLYLDNNHMEGELDPAWCKPGVNEKAFPRGICADGTQVSATTETAWHDAARRLVRFIRTVTIRTPDGKEYHKEWAEQKHPPSTKEMQEWLAKYGFVVEEFWGDRHRSPYTDKSGRAVFWARKQ